MDSVLEIVLEVKLEIVIKHKGGTS